MLAAVLSAGQMLIGASRSRSTRAEVETVANTEIGNEEQTTAEVTY